MKPSLDREHMKVLVVDDMPSMRSTIRNMLRQLGYVHIREAEDGRGAWNRMKAEKFDVAVVDWNMPHMNGIELLRKARADEELGSLPFVMVTAEVNEETIAEAAETEVD
ncbi:MAG TPA: response regulator, partial [Syntrophales bacterium]|nr:response regulator [Syntrophales bacterium]